MPARVFRDPDGKSLSLLNDEKDTRYRFTGGHS